MTYTFTTDVTAEEIEKFLAALPHYNVMQSPALRFCLYAVCRSASK